MASDFLTAELGKSQILNRNNPLVYSEHLASKMELFSPKSPMTFSGQIQKTLFQSLHYLTLLFTVSPCWPCLAFLDNILSWFLFIFLVLNAGHFFFCLPLNADGSAHYLFGSPNLYNTNKLKIQKCVYHSAFFS